MLTSSCAEAFSQSADSKLLIVEESLAKDPSNRELLNSALEYSIAEQNWDKAIFYNCSLLNLEPNSENLLKNLGDLYSIKKQFPEAIIAYQSLVQIYPKEEYFLALAEIYRMQKNTQAAKDIYHSILAQNPCSEFAIIGLGYIAIDEKEYAKARAYFCDVLSRQPDNQAARMGVVHSFTANGENIRALEVLERMPQGDDVKYEEAKAYYDMGIHTEALDAVPLNPQYNLTNQRASYELPMYEAADELLKGMVTETAESKLLKHRLGHDKAITIIPSYSLLIQRLADSFKLDINKIGTTVSEVVGNKNAFLTYNMYIYSSGKFNTGRLNNVTNELRMGVQERVSEKVEYRADIGGKFFEFGGVMANTDSWVKYFFNDKFNLKAGFQRNNVEQSYLSAVGFNIDGIFTGRVADNTAYIGYEAKLPKQCYSFGSLGYGAMTGENMLTNQYLEGMVGVGKVMYNNPDNKWINLVNLDFISYNSSYQYNLLRLYNNAGDVFGGYFSPGFFTANTANLKMEGEIKKWHLTYGIRGFAGAQVAQRPDAANVIFGISPYISYVINDHITINAAYNYFNYADVQRDQFIINAVIRGRTK